MTTVRRRFEVIVYNKIVRELVDRHESHRRLKDEWADNHYQEIVAADAEQARRKVEQRYPKHQGFVIADVVEIEAYDGDDEEDVPTGGTA